MADDDDKQPGPQAAFIEFVFRIKDAILPLAEDANKRGIPVKLLVALHCAAVAMVANSVETVEAARILDELCTSSARGAWLTTLATLFPESTEATAVRIGNLGRAMEEHGLKPRDGTEN